MALFSELSCSWSWSASVYYSVCWPASVWWVCEEVRSLFKISKVGLSVLGGEWKAVPNRWTCSQSQPVLPLGSGIVQRWTAVPRAGQKVNHTQCLWLPQGLETHWPGHPAAHTPTHTQADWHTHGWPCKVFTRSVTNRHYFRLQGAKSTETLVWFSLWFKIIVCIATNIQVDNHFQSQNLFGYRENL